MKQEKQQPEPLIPFHKQKFFSIFAGNGHEIIKEAVLKKYPTWKFL